VGADLIAFWKDLCRRTSGSPPLGTLVVLWAACGELAGSWDPLGALWAEYA
jgi:hypothetical protein